MVANRINRRPKSEQKHTHARHCIVLSLAVQDASNAKIDCSKQSLTHHIHSWVFRQFDREEASVSHGKHVRRCTVALLDLERLWPRFPSRWQARATPHKPNKFT